MSRESGNGTIILWTSLDSCGYLQEATEVLCSLADNNSFLSQIIPQKNSRILARLKVLGKECHACLCMCLCMWTYAACMHACHSVWVCVCVVFKCVFARVCVCVCVRACICVRMYMMVRYVITFPDANACTVCIPS